MEVYRIFKLKEGMGSKLKSALERHQKDIDQHLPKNMKNFEVLACPLKTSNEVLFRFECDNYDALESLENAKQNGLSKAWEDISACLAHELNSDMTPFRMYKSVKEIANF